MMALLPSLEMQPTFTFELPISAGEAMRRISDVIRTSEQHTETAGNSIDFKIPPSEQRFWSPHLSVQLSDQELGARGFGRFSPRPEIWTMFMAVYAIVAFTIFGAMIFASVQWLLGRNPWSLVIVALGILLIGSLHVASLVGQRLSGDQMRILRDRLDSVLHAALRDDQMPST